MKYVGISKCEQSFFWLVIAFWMGFPLLQLNAGVIRVPSDFPTIAQAVQNAQAGDTILLSKGTHNGSNIEINKSLTISSEWLLTGDETIIDQTVIIVPETILFSVNSDDVEISGLRIMNGDHTLDINARTTVRFNHMENNLDPVSMETGGGGYVGYNVFENNGDDGIDLDIGVNGSRSGSDIIIEYNTIINSDDDGIEIRLFNTADQNIHYTIRHNTISGSRRAGIQLISYDVFTGKVFDIHHNVILDCKVGVGCMGGSNTIEDLSGAAFMDEKVYLYNNTFIKNEMGATGGNSMIAINNVIANNSLGGFKRFGDQSAIANNLFYHNNNSDLVEFHTAVQQTGNIMDEDPMLEDASFVPATGSPCIDAGLDHYALGGINVIEIDAGSYTGAAPDIGAKESSEGTASIPAVPDIDPGFIRIYPNPFSTTSNIEIHMSGPGDVTVEIHDMTGRLVRTLDGGMRNRGIQTISLSAEEERGVKLPGGIYLARVRAGNLMYKTIKLLLDRPGY